MARKETASGGGGGLGRCAPSGLQAACERLWARLGIGNTLRALQEVELQRILPEASVRAGIRHSRSGAWAGDFRAPGSCRRKGRDHAILVCLACPGLHCWSLRVHSSTRLWAESYLPPPFDRLFGTFDSPALKS